MTDEASGSARPERLRRVAIAGGVLAAIGAVIYIFAVWSDAPEGDAAAIPSLDDDPPTLAGAIEKARLFTGHSAEETTARSLVLLGWSNRHLKWKDAEVARDETSYELVGKGGDAQIGKRMCVQGKVAVIHLVKTDASRSAAGVLVTGDAKPFAFMAARNMGAVQEQQQARLCGFVTGWNAAESDLGPASAVVLVGLFEADKDLPVGQ